MKNNKEKKKLVIVGGGFGGITVAKEILRRVPGKFSITLIDKKDYQLFHPAMFKALSSFEGSEKLTPLATIKFKDIFEGQDVSIKKKEAEKMPSDYDYLVLSAGSEPNFFNVKPTENTLTFKTLDDVFEVKERIKEIFKTKAKRDDVNIVVVGGGATGCSLATKLQKHVHEWAKREGHPQKTLKFKLVAGGGVLKTLPLWIQRSAEKVLKDLDIEIINGCYVESMDEKGCMLDDGVFMNADLLVWAGGVKPNHNFGKKTSRRLRADGEKNVFMIGDIVHPDSRSFAGPPTAQSAIRQGKYVANAIIKMEKGEKFPKYRFKKSITVVELGDEHFFVDLGILRLTGWMADLVHLLGFLGYLKNILSWRKAGAWVKLYKSL